MLRCFVQAKVNDQDQEEIRLVISWQYQGQKRGLQNDSNTCHGKVD
jgi:hypothetical protein